MSVILFYLFTFSDFAFTFTFCDWKVMVFVVRKVYTMQLDGFHERDVARLDMQNLTS